MHCLLVYRPADGAVLHFKVFEEDEKVKALLAASALKRRNTGRDDVTVHLLGAGSLAEVKKICPQYFAYGSSVFTDPGHCHQTFEFPHIVLTCDNSQHTSWADDPDLHYDPEWELAWLPHNGHV